MAEAKIDWQYMRLPARVLDRVKAIAARRRAAATAGNPGVPGDAEAEAALWRTVELMCGQWERKHERTLESRARRRRRRWPEEQANADASLGHLLGRTPADGEG